VHIVVGANDSFIRFYDMTKLAEPIQILESKAAVNCVRMSVDRKMLLTVGDHKDVEFWDLRSNQRVLILSGHKDHAFTADWSPNNENQCATGSQDCTCRIWDIRKDQKQELTILPAKVGSVYSLRYSRNGEYLAFGEMMDYVQIYHVPTNYECFQEIDCFGQIVGVDFDPSEDTLFFGVRINSNEGIFEYRANGKERELKIEDCWL